MTFPSLSNALAFSKFADADIHVRIEGHPGVVFQVYPGGRTIKWPEDKLRIVRIEATDERLAEMQFKFNCGGPAR